VGLPPSADVPTAVYANYVALSHSEFEVVLDFAQMVLPLTEQELSDLGDNPHIVAKPVARIAIPHILLPRLIKAMEARQKAMDEETAGAKGKDEN
jgi:hypothetical protein